MKWSTIALLEYDGYLEDVAVELGNNVVLCPRPDWLITEEITYGLSEQDQTDLNISKYVLMQEYEADSLGDPDPGWTGETPRSKQQKAEEAINLADTALWLAKPSPIGFRRVIVAHSPSGVWTRVQFGRANPLRCHTLDVDNKYDSSDLQTAKELNRALLGLGWREAIWIACRTLWLALLTREWTVRYLLLWTALETLFGPEDGREVTYRISQRLAFFLSEEKAEVRKKFQESKKGYEWRCRVVHGMRLSKLKPEESERIMHEAESMVRDSLKRILGDPTLIKHFNGTNREPYLDDLVFSS
jgi:hypothetical protein